MVLPAGKPVPNPAEVLAGPGFGRVIAELERNFDRIVIDTAPVTAVSDTLLLVEHAQAVCLVARAGRTPRKWTLRAIRLLTDAGAKPTGLILNQVPMHMSHAYSYYPGSYGDPGVYGSNVPGRSGGEKGRNRRSRDHASDLAGAWSIDHNYSPMRSPCRSRRKVGVRQSAAENLPAHATPRLPAPSPLVKSSTGSEVLERRAFRQLEKSL